jgi:hypothetical protein
LREINFRLNEVELHKEIEKRRSNFKELAQVDIWIVETVFYDSATSAGFRGYVDFKRYAKGEIIEDFAFQDGVLVSRSRDGMPIQV